MGIYMNKKISKQRRHKNVGGADKGAQESVSDVLAR